MNRKKTGGQDNTLLYVSINLKTNLSNLVKNKFQWNSYSVPTIRPEGSGKNPHCEHQPFPRRLRIKRNIHRDEIALLQAKDKTFWISISR